MVIKGKCRGNGSQLADYLLSDKNDRAELLDIIGTTNPNDLKRSLVEMALTAMTTKSTAGLYHAQINPDPKAPGMTKEAWLKSVEILAKELGLEGQRRAIVLHEKDGRTHAHVVFERYQEGRGKNQQGILWDDKGNYEKHYKASRAIEQVLGHERTPEKDVKQTQNKRNLDVKKTLTDLWNRHTEPAQFIAEAQKLGFTVSQGEDRRPYKVIDPDGKSLDLVRQIDKVKTAEVAERLNPLRKTLKTEKEVLTEAQKRQQVKEQPKKEQAPPLALKWDLGKVQTNSPKISTNTPEKDKARQESKFAEFKAAANDNIKPQEPIPAKTVKNAIEEYRKKMEENKRKTDKELAKFREMTEEQQREALKRERAEQMEKLKREQEQRLKR